MVSDVLLEAISKIDKYLNHGFYQDYPIQDEIIIVREAMNNLLSKLDKVPNVVEVN